MASPSTSLQPAQQSRVPVKGKTKSTFWVWEATDREGKVKTGEMESIDEATVESRLLAMGLNPTSIKKKPFELKLPSIGGGVPQRDLLNFTRMFATMLDAGLPIVQCLDLLAAQQDNAEMKRVLTAVKNKVESGSTFAEALREHPKVFDTLYTSLVDAGEVAGILDNILNRLIVTIEKSAAIKKKVKGALTYPALVIVAGIGIVIVLLIFVIPTFAKMFADMGSGLPAPTQMIIDASTWMQNYWPYVLLTIFSIVAFFSFILSNKTTRRKFDTIVLTLPLFGDLICKQSVASFTRTLGTMVSAGVPILDSLDLVARTAGNMRIEEAIYYVREKISEGSRIAEPLAETKIFPDLVTQMINVGEQAGALDQMLGKIADFYDEEVDVTISTLLSMMEPAIMVVLGGGCGFMLISMYLPIFSMAGGLS